MTKQRRKGALTRRLQAGRSSHSRDQRLGIAQTVARCVAGPDDGSISDDTFREQMIAFLPRLSGFALSLTGNADQRDDLVQETCARALLHKDQWQPGTRLDSWMFRIAQNLWLDLKRADKYRGDPIDIESVSDTINCDGQALVENRLALAEVLRGLDRLAPEHRILIGLVCVDGMTYKQASEVLELPVGTVMSRLARARLALHEAIKGTLTSKEMRRGRPFR